MSSLAMETTAMGAVQGLRAEDWSAVWRLPADATCAGAARSHLKETLMALGLPGDLIHSAATVAGELAANAGRHSRSGAPGGLLIVEVCRWKGGAALAVTDQGDPVGTPSPQIAVYGRDPTREHGHGLRIVDEPSAFWGVRGGPAGRSFIAIFVW